MNFVLVLAGLTGLVVAADQIKNRYHVDPKKTREFVHAAVAVVVFFAPLLFTLISILLSLTF
ncbi:MAG: hypothetical protein M1378_03205 [Bacteroidetes bacterium]|nr:hypothetical protein [Bacteroidota bacterium]